MLSILLASVLSFAPQGGTVFTADGGRVRGTVLDDGAAGVTVQLADGSTRTLLRAQIVRIELADGTALRPAARAATPEQASAPAAVPASPEAVAPAPPVAPVAVPAPVAAAAPAAAAPVVAASTVAPALAPAPAVAPPAAVAPPPATRAAPAAPASPAPPMPATAPVVTLAPPPPAAAARPSPLTIPPERLDTVHLARGGRVRCLVVEEGADGVVARLVDGTERRFAPGQVTRVDWADGTRSELPPAVAPAAP